MSVIAWSFLFPDRWGKIFSDLAKTIVTRSRSLIRC